MTRRLTRARCLNRERRKKTGVRKLKAAGIQVDRLAGLLRPAPINIAFTGISGGCRQDSRLLGGPLSVGMTALSARWSKAVTL
ncbi:MAG: hypothetical protein JSS49_04715 [Planctomycetes bacterium]|nr:hypothetical protein [Planctomycetota bacterium]